jgi:hypothetical protein
VDEPDAAQGVPLVPLVGELDQYEDSYQLCYVRGPEGIIVALAGRSAEAFEAGHEAFPTQPRRA